METVMLSSNLLRMCRLSLLPPPPDAPDMPGMRLPIPLIMFPGFCACKKIGKQKRKNRILCAVLDLKWMGLLERSDQFTEYQGELGLSLVGSLQHFSMCDDIVFIADTQVGDHTHGK